ncbi:MAG: hypothetical protein IT428_01120 [Planctomycetaceae bacterium]|nr:hypothetical protein [Planctomycetaceae bacterium]
MPIRKPNLILPIVAVAVLLLGGYVLSYGPAAAWCDANQEGWGTFFVFYAPLEWLSGRAVLIERALDAYCEWWMK